MRSCFLLLILSALALVVAPSAIAADGPGSTRVAKWKDDKQAAFMLMFDDSCATHVKNAIPELVKRKMVGTFYLNPGSGQFAGLKNDWENVIPKLGMEYANHTFTHKGAKDAENLDEELQKCDDAIAKILGKRPALVSFGRPGVPQGAWTVTDQELKDALAKHHLIMRPNVDGRFAEINLKTADALFGIAEKALAAGSSDCVIFHGVGGDWLTAQMPVYIGLLDKLVAVQDKLWIAGHIAIYSYQMEREGAAVKVEQAGGTGIKLTLTTTADPALFSTPLTLVTRVPSDWKRCRVLQGETTATVPVTDGVARYDAKPDGSAISLHLAP
ncbi:MAG TPA: polysaccharide deacetylase family protein [Planctomycetota bacterium]|nr:polysaccharide deacetylase family protein [Planctomycetota bacterium]